MTNITALVRAWLVAGPVSDVCGERVATVFDPADGVPALRIGQVTGGPGTTAFTNIDIVETWQVALYVHAGRLAGGFDDLPDDGSAWSVIAAVADACRDIDWEHFEHDGARIAGARVVSAAPGVDPDTGDARATITLALSVWQ